MPTETAPNAQTALYIAQFNMINRLSNKRGNMKDNSRRTQILAGHSKIIKVLNGFKF